MVRNVKPPGAAPTRKGRTMDALTYAYLACLMALTGGFVIFAAVSATAY